ncbi:SpoIIE family protein phosphatase [Streptomyces sp. NPDC006460]|uniref:SpoIIE family protein phosphatase n=1 Tax=Streptomyces sp. NPDC006460 TaxID=3154304 RepID=UPI0033AD3D41
MTRTTGPAGADHEVGASLVETVRRAGASVGALYLLSPDEPVLCLSLLCGAPAEFAAPWSRVPLASPAPVADAVREERLVWAGSQEEMARTYPRTAMALPYPCALAAAPVTGGRPWGTLLLIWPPTHPPALSGRERGRIASACRALARLLAEAAASGTPLPACGTPRELPFDREAGAAGATPDAAADFAERLPGGSCALDLTGRVTFVSSGGATLLGREPGELLGTLPWESLPWLDDPSYEDRYRAAVINREPVSFTALRPPDTWLDFHLYPDPGGVSVRIVPTGSRPPPVPAPAWPPREAAPARAGQLYQLMYLAAGLTEVVGVQDVVDLIADQIMPAFGAQGLVLAMADAGRLRITGHRGYPAAVVERLDGLPIDTVFTPAGRALARGVPLFFADPQEMAAHYREARVVSGKHAWAFLPLIISGRPVGVCVLSYDHPHRFPAEERAVMTSLAGLIAQALDRARLYDATLGIAHGLQQALLPHSLPAVAGLDVAARYLPATHGMDIGGDFYDLIPLGEDVVAAVIGDVQGHNVAAAALMGQVRTAVHAHATVGVPPDEVLSRTDRLLTDLDSDLFTSCLYLRLDFARRLVRLSDAGHPPPLVRLPGRAARPVDVAPGPPLGVDPDADRPVTEFPLVPGMLIVLYTDGLVETPGEDPDESVQRLARLLTEADDSDLELLIDSVLEQLRPAAKRLDDIALLVLRCDTDPDGTDRVAGTDGEHRDRDR